MQLAVEFPLTLTLSPKERESLWAIWGCSLNSEPFPAPPMVSLSYGERAGVRGNGPSKRIVTAKPWRFDPGLDYGIPLGFSAIGR